MSIIKRVVATWPWVLTAAIFFGVVSVTPRLWQLEHWGLLTGAWGALALTVFCLLPARMASWRGLYPLLLVIWLGLLWPLLHSIGLVLWHVDGAHIHSLPAAQQELLQETVPSGMQMDIELVSFSNQQFVIRFWPAGTNNLRDEELIALIEGQPQSDRDKAVALYHTPLLTLQADNELTSLPEQTVVVLRSGPGPSPKKEEPLMFGQHFDRHIKTLRFVLPNGQRINDTKPRYQIVQHPASAYALQEIGTGKLFLPNPAMGFFQSQNKAGQWLGEPLRPGFVYWAGWDNWHYWVPHIPILVKQTLWSLLLASLAVGLAAFSATAWVACLRRFRYPNLALYLLVLPAAVPLALLAQSMKVLFANHGEVNQLFHLFSGWVPEWPWWERGPAHASLLLAAWWWLSPLFTLWFYVLGKGQRAWPGWHKAGPSLILAWISLVSGPTLIMCFTAGRPDYLNSDLGGYTDGLITLMHKLAFEGWQQYSTAMVPLLLLLPIVLAANGLRLALLKKPRLDTTQPSVPVTRSWLSGAGLLLGIVLHALPLLLLFLVSFHLSNQLYDFTEDAWCWLSRDGLSLRHWYGVFGLDWVDSFGMLERPTFPILRWMANSWLWALLHSAISLLLALSAVAALHRMAPQEAKHVRYGLYCLQGLLPSLGIVGLFSLWWIQGRAIADYHAGLLYLVLGLTTALMWVEPLYQQNNSTKAKQSRWQLWTALFLLGLILQLGEYPLAELLFSQETQLTIPLGSQRVMFSGFPRPGQMGAMTWLYSLPIMVLLGLLIPLLNRQVVQHWRP